MLNTKEAAAFLKLHPVYLASLRPRGTGPSFHKLGRAVRYRQSDLDAWVNARRFERAA